VCRQKRLHPQHHHGGWHPAFRQFLRSSHTVQSISELQHTVLFEAVPIRILNESLRVAVPVIKTKKPEHFHYIPNQHIYTKSEGFQQVDVRLVDLLIPVQRFS
jgi:hypothetical protein